MAMEKEKAATVNIPQQAHKAARAETAPAPVRRYRSYLFVFLLVLVAAGFGILTFFVKTVHSIPFDLVITEGIQSINFQPFDTLMVAISWLGFFPQAAM